MGEFASIAVFNGGQARSGKMTAGDARLMMNITYLVVVAVIVAKRKKELSCCDKTENFDDSSADGVSNVNVKQ